MLVPFSLFRRNVKNVMVELQEIALGTASVQLSERIRHRLGRSATQTAFITVNGQDVAIIQPASACSYVVGTTEIQAPATGSTGSIAVTTSCPIIATSSQSWVSAIALPSSVNYQIAANSSTTARSASITIGNQNVSVSQAGLNTNPTTISLTSAPNPSTLGQIVKLTATVTGQGSGTPTGAVTFNDGSTPLGTSPLSGSTATLSTASLALGLHSVNAVYSGDSNFTGSTSNTLSQNVTQVSSSTTTTLVPSVNPSVSGKPVTFTAAVSSSAGTPMGMIRFLNGATVLATMELKSGSAKYTTSKLPLGTNSITAVYVGDSNYSGSTSLPVQQIVLDATTTRLFSLPNPSSLGQAITFSGIVLSGDGVPPWGETITFMDGKTVLGTGLLSGGSASFTTSKLKVGKT